MCRPRVFSALARSVVTWLPCYPSINPALELLSGNCEREGSMTEFNIFTSASSERVTLASACQRTCCSVRVLRPGRCRSPPSRDPRARGTRNSYAPAGPHSVACPVSVGGFPRDSSTPFSKQSSMCLLAWSSCKAKHVLRMTIYVSNCV